MYHCGTVGPFLFSSWTFLRGLSVTGESWPSLVEFPLSQLSLDGCKFYKVTFFIDTKKGSSNPFSHLCHQRRFHLSIGHISALS